MNIVVAKIPSVAGYYLRSEPEVKFLESIGYTVKDAKYFYYHNASIALKEFFRKCNPEVENPGSNYSAIDCLDAYDIVQLSDTVTIDLSELIDHFSEFTIVSKIKVKGQTQLDISSKLIRLSEALESGLDANSVKNMTEFFSGITERIKEIEKTAFNQKCNVHVSNNMLLHFNQTKVEYDCCTDHLNKQLQDGWRIIAVCPQPDQRRPDYVLGRYEPETN